MTKPPAKIPNSAMKLERNDTETYQACLVSPTFEVKQELGSLQLADSMTHSALRSEETEKTIQKIKDEPCENDTASLCQHQANIPEQWKRTVVVGSGSFYSPEGATVSHEYPAIIRTSDGGSHNGNTMPIVSPSTTTGMRLPLDNETYNRVIFAETATNHMGYVTRHSKKRKTKYPPAAKFIHSETYALSTRGRPRDNEVEDRVLDPKSREWKEKQALWQSSVISYDPSGLHISPRFLSPQSPSDISPGYFHERSRYPALAEDGFYYTRESGNVDSVGQTSINADVTTRPACFMGQRESNVTTTAGYQGREPVIKDVVSLAQAQHSETETVQVGKRLTKRPRKSTDSRNSTEKPDSGESTTSDMDESLTAGKYISDLVQPYVNIPDDHQVAHINGLLSLPSNRETRYGITYGELKRRCNSPESLTRVDLVAYVRHSKSSGRNLLDKYGIVSSGNRSSSPTVLSKMCENEARVLGDGILKMNMDYFPGKMLAQMAAGVTEEAIRTASEQKKDEKERKNKIREKMNQIEITRSMLKETYDLLLGEKESEEMKRFELASHTFGTANLMNHLTLFDRFFEDYQTSLAKKK